ncbi:SDR family NAD(P)-dependent oxidoreductase [Saccharopolyspora erythraea]|uniref:SDR family NAD(P)-dependent oxidoreductase n=1 Tax=Saccharopolyspora erythraea TaxID=1836 RepID=UPI001BA594B1|nr:SDR family NAD(P)-dependent oxidoreductase [Saccharopolyspora erythraea]QUH02697.1 SDR family NAD(P)-dependent oxidoreductase [Saccharopolyspora erythraea]
MTTTSQHKIGSGFGASSTAADVLAGADLSGKLAIVTGGYSGIGLETTRALAGAGAQVVVPARRRATAAEATAGIDRVELDTVELDDLGSVRAFAERFLESGRDIDILIGGAGVMACPETRVGPGWEGHFAINHLGHHALVNLLWPALARGGARVVAVSSAGHQISGIRWDDVHFERGYDKWLAYAQSKTANALFAARLDVLGRDAGVRSFSLHPGAILTPLQRHLRRSEMVANGWVDADGNLVADGFKTPEQGAATQVWAATSPRLEGMGGAYCEDCDIAEPTESTAMVAGVRDYATDPEQAARLWSLSAELTGVDAFAGIR